MGLTVTILGCDGSYAGPGGACSGYLLRHGDTSVWVDCGPGTLAHLQEHVPLEQLTGIVVSHAHPDHWIELPVTLNALRFYVERRDVPLYATAETFNRLRAIKGPPTHETFDTSVIAEQESFEVGSISFRTSLTDHPVETLALRAEAGGRSLTYSADTGPRWSLDALGEVDLALCEATLRADQAGRAPHLSTTEAGERARAAGAARLVITHLAPGADVAAARSEAADAYGAEVDVARIGLTLEV